MVKAIGYLRVSTAEQAAHGFGLKAQERAVRALCKRKGWRLVAIHRDEGESGSNGLDSRIGLATALADCEAGAAERLVVAKIDRLARDMLLQLTIADRLGKAGVEVVSVEEPDMDGADDLRDLIRNVLASVAQYERAVIRARMLAGKAAKASQGGYTGGRPAYGYKAQDGALVPDAGEQAVIALAAQLRREGLSLRAIGARLEEEGYRPKAGGAWQPNQVRRLLDRR